MTDRISLLSAASATGTEKTVIVPGNYTFAVAGTFGGSVVGLQMLGPDGATWISVADELAPLAFATAGAIVVACAAGSYRATITGGSGVSLYADLRHVGPVAP